MRNIYIVFLASTNLGVGVRRPAMPLGPLIVAGAIRRSPHFGRSDRVVICDTFREVLRVASRHQKDRIFFMVSSMQAIRGVNKETNPALACLVRLKKCFPKVVSCVGGPDVSLNLDDYLGSFDVVFQGEVGSLDPVEILPSGRPFFQAPPANMNAEPLDYGLLAGRTYLSGSIQTTRGCPHGCRFCNIGHIFGRRLRTIDPGLLEERLESLARIHRGFVIIGDDNFGGGVEENMQAFLEVIIRFQERRRFPFLFAVQASLETARSPEILALMRKANITAAFIGVESPSEDVLAAAHKSRNFGKPLAGQIEAFTRHGILPYISLILRLDREPGDIGFRIRTLLETCRTPFFLLNLINPAIGSKFRDRAAAEGRLLDDSPYLSLHLMPLKTDRPYTAVIRDYIDILTWFYKDRRVLDFCDRIERKAKEGLDIRALETFVSGLPAFSILKVLAVYIGTCLRSGSATGLLHLVKLIGRSRAEIVYFLAIRGIALGAKAGTRAEIRRVLRGLEKLRVAGLYPYGGRSLPRI